MRISDIVFTFDKKLWSNGKIFTMIDLYERLWLTDNDYAWLEQFGLSHGQCDLYCALRKIETKKMRNEKEKSSDHCELVTCFGRIGKGAQTTILP